MPKGPKYESEKDRKKVRVGKVVLADRQFSGARGNKSRWLSFPFSYSYHRQQTCNLGNFLPLRSDIHGTGKLSFPCGNDTKLTTPSTGYGSVTLCIARKYLPRKKPFLSGTAQITSPPIRGSSKFNWKGVVGRCSWWMVGGSSWWMYVVGENRWWR